MTAHSKIGASSAYRWSVCPGSVRLSAGVESRSSEYALLGTAAHELAAKCLEGEKNADEFLGTEIEVDKDGAKATFEVDDEMAEAVQLYLDTCRQQWATAKATLPSGLVMIEHRFDLSSVHAGMFGTSDFAVVDVKNKTLYVTDYKHGAGKPVEVFDNMQLKYYALGVLMDMLKANREIEKVVLCIVQPRCYHRDGPVRTFEMEAWELIDYATELIEYAKATEDPNAPLVPGDHCGFCPAAATCPVLQARAEAAFDEAMAQMEGGVDTDVAEWLPKLDTIEAFCSAVRSAAYAQASSGKKVMGYKLVEKQGRRKFIDEDAVRKFLKDRGVTEAEMHTPPKLKSPAQVEKLEPFKGKAAKDAKEALQAFITTPKAGTALVPEDDPRPAYDAGADFEDLEQDPFK